MGTQFSWFYDVIAVAIVLVCVFLSGRKGTLKAAISAVGCAIALLLAIGISAGAAESLYSNTMRSSNIKKIEKVITRDTLPNRYTTYLDSLTYSIHPSLTNLEKLFDSDKNYDEALCDYINNANGRRIADDEESLEIVHEGYAVVVGEIVGQCMSKYASAVAAEEVRKDPESMQELIPLLRDDENMTPAAKYIADHYTAAAYINIIKLAGQVILFAAMALLIVFISNSISNGYRSTNDVESPGAVSHIFGGILGIATGAIVVFVTVAVVRLWAILGSNEMLFFNSDVIDQSYIFKYFFNIASKL